MNYGTYRTQICHNFMEELHFNTCTIASHNYLTNMSFPTEYNNKSFLKF